MKGSVRCGRRGYASTPTSAPRTTAARFTNRPSSGRGEPDLPASRAVVGLGESGDVQRASILDMSGDLPLVDEEAELRAFLDTLLELTDVGLVTLEVVEVTHYGRTALPAL